MESSNKSLPPVKATILTVGSSYAPSTETAETEGLEPGEIQDEAPRHLHNHNESERTDDMRLHRATDEVKKMASEMSHLVRDVTSAVSMCESRGELSFSNNAVGEVGQGEGGQGASAFGSKSGE